MYDPDVCRWLIQAVSHGERESDCLEKIGRAKGISRHVILNLRYVFLMEKSKKTFIIFAISGSGEGAEEHRSFLDERRNGSSAAENTTSIRKI